MAQSQAFMEEMRDVAVELPNVTFEDNLVIHGKAHDVHLAFRGRGHTAGDIVAFCPQKKVVASGDLFADVNEVYTLKRNILARLRRNPDLKGLY